MLKYIKVRNFLSFKEETEINFESNFYWNLKDNAFSVWWKESKKTVLMKNMLIYWANASGKSNLIKAVDFIRWFALSSKKRYFFSWKLLPFRLDIKSKETPSFFEIWMYINESEYTYCFEILEKNVISEKLTKSTYINKEIREEIIFERDADNIKPGINFTEELKKWEWKIKSTSSVISVLSEWNWQLEWEDIWNHFRKINVLSLNDSTEKFSGKMIKGSKNVKDFFVKFLQYADIGIQDIKIWEKSTPSALVEALENSTLSDERKELIIEAESMKIEFWHFIKWKNELEFFDISEESDGTRKVFEILGPIIEAIFNEEILFIDEVENKLHLHILQELIKFINSDIQWKKYQLFFTTHNVSLMDLNVLKSEQIWIVDKSKEWCSEFYTLYDFDEVRTGRDIQKYFNAGAYWWIPHVGDFSELLSNLDLWVDQKRR